MRFQDSRASYYSIFVIDCAAVNCVRVVSPLSSEIHRSRAFARSFRSSSRRDAKLLRYRRYRSRRRSLSFLNANNIGTARDLVIACNRSLAHSRSQHLLLRFVLLPSRSPSSISSSSEFHVGSSPFSCDRTANVNYLYRHSIHESPIATASLSLPIPRLALSPVIIIPVITGNVYFHVIVCLSLGLCLPVIRYRRGLSGSFVREKSLRLRSTNRGRSAAVCPACRTHFTTRTRKKTPR